MCVWPLARRSGLGLRLWIVWPLRVLVSLRGVNQLPMFGPLSPAQMRRPSSNEGKRRHPNPRSDMPPGSGGHRGPPRPNDCHCRMTLMPRAPLIVNRLGSLSCAGACGLNLKKISSHVILDFVSDNQAKAWIPPKKRSSCLLLLDDVETSQELRMLSRSLSDCQSTI